MINDLLKEKINKSFLGIFSYIKKEIKNNLFKIEILNNRTKYLKKFFGTKFY